VIGSSRNGLKPELQTRVVPACAVVEHWKSLPDSRGLLGALFGEIFPRARPRPFLPFGDVAVTHGIVMEVVQGGPKVLLASHGSIRGAMLALASTLTILAIPGKRGATMQFSHLGDQFGKIGDG